MNFLGTVGPGFRGVFSVGGAGLVFVFVFPCAIFGGSFFVACLACFRGRCGGSLNAGF